MIGSVLVAVTASLLAGFGTAQAAVVSEGPFASRSSCTQQQTDFARYYKITRQCTDVGNGVYYFWYEKP